MDEAKCADCACLCGYCLSGKREKRQRLNYIASSDACGDFKPRRAQRFAASKQLSGGFVLILAVVDIAYAYAWLTDNCWIVMGYDGGFGQYLEHCYFTPGTPKNAEFEVMAGTMEVDGVFGLGAFYRIRDTVENREALRAAITEFHDKRLLTLAELDHVIDALRRDIRENVVPKLR